jgi:transcriptional regulator GlxA family with amidase domain
VALLAETGLLDGKRATTHWALADAYRARWPRIDWQPEHFVTESGRLFCAGGVYAALDLSLHLVERYAGYDVAMQTARALLLETRRTAQAGFAVPAHRSEHGDAEVAAAEEWMRQHLREALRVDALARRFGMSPRSFARRFKLATGETPLAYLHGVRIEAAKHLLETGARPLREIAGAVGYEDVAFFRALFKRRTGAAPAAWRRRFARPPAAPRIRGRRRAS